MLSNVSLHNTNAAGKLLSPSELPLLSQMPSPLAVLRGPNFIIDFANDALLRIWGKKASEVLQQPYFKVFEELRGTGLENIYRQVFETGVPQTREEVSYWVQRNGEEAEEFYKIIYTPIRDASGMVVGIMAPGYDITGQVRARREAEEKQVFNHTILESSPDCVKIIDRDGRLVSMTTQGLCLMEVDDFCLIQNQYWWMLWPEASREAVRDSVVKGLQGKPSQFMAFCPTTKGTPKWWDVVVTPIRDAGGNISQILSISRDITSSRKDESELRYRGALLEAIQEGSPDGILLTGPDKETISYNSRFAQQWHLPQHQTGKGAPWLAALAAQQLCAPGQLMAQMDRLYSHPSETSLDELEFKDGTTLERHGYPVIGADGTHYAWAWVFRDITHRQRYKATLWESEKRFRSTFENAEAGIAHVAPDGRLLLVNQRFCDIIGYKQEELLDRGFQDITYPEDLQSDLALVQQVLQGNRDNYELEKRYIRKDGQTVWVSLTVSLVRDEAGMPQYFISVIQDLTQRKIAEEKLRQSELRYRMLAESLEYQVAERTAELEQSQAFLKSILNRTQNGIITYQPIRNAEGAIADFRITFINDMVTRDLGINPADIIGKTMLEAFPNATTNGIFTHLVGFLDHNESGHFPLIVPHTDGPLYFDMAADRMGDGATITISNITGQRRAALQLEALNKELKRSNADLQQFAHVASHDLKEPVRKIKTFTSRLQQELEGKIDERNQQYLNKVQSAASRMITMIDGVLKYSTLSATEEAEEVVDLNELFHNIESDLEVLLQQKSAVLEVAPLPSLKGAPVLLYQLFYNLINNSLKFSRAGVPPHIQVSATPVQKEGKSFIQIRVMDNGIGFDTEYAEQIFATFTRLNSKDQYEGTGLGLALCQKIVERHGGTISATSQKGLGSAFSILLPMPA